MTKTLVFLTAFWLHVPDHPKDYYVVFSNDHNSDLDFSKALQYAVVNLLAKETLRGMLFQF